MGVDTHYDRLVANKEVIELPLQAINLRGPNTPEFDQDSVTLDEQEHLINALLASQLNLAKVVCSLSSYSKSLQKRLIILQRIYTAVSKKHHNKDCQGFTTPENRLTDNCNGEDIRKTLQPSIVAGTEHKGHSALIELGVKTGLSLLFSLLQQNWMLSSQLNQLSFCNDILRTATSVMLTFPPLSLANESKLSPLAIESMDQVSRFLRQAATSGCGADLDGQRLASEFMLLLATQRGSLCHVLEWVDMAMNTCVSLTHATSTQETSAGKISWEFFHNIMTQVIKSVVS